MVYLQLPDEINTYEKLSEFILGTVNKEFDNEIPEVHSVSSEFDFDDLEYFKKIGEKNV